ncbi:hypothetical protein MHLP_03690 [Candidatus Mycoplasma haematolamae str. Purdue]|uniref:Uncharacterized protein n=1 Tax=Mycoplasma haematolamae (strain Purdue) TaxID=1212765 RepID=I7BKA9_MYCHA|nr:hypothetical protein MHLP_03690 [Candidatus Mycoplasma haematolamae str. Purdue]
MVVGGANWSWQSVTYTGKKLTETKKTYQTVKGYVEPSWQYIKSHWYTLWIFLRSSLTSVDLEKLYKLFTEKKSQAMQSFQGDRQSSWKTIMGNMETLVNKSGSVGYDVSKPFNKILRTFMDTPEKMSTIADRLSFVEKYVTENSNQRDAAKKLVDFFSNTEDAISKLNYNS